MKRVPANEARAELADLINQVAYGKERVVLTRRGRDSAALVSMADVKTLERLEEKIDLEDVKTRTHEPRIPFDDVMRELKIPVRLPRTSTRRKKKV